MPTQDFSPFHQNPGTGADGTKFNNLIDAIQTAVNGLDQGNFAPGQKRTVSPMSAGPPGSPADGDVWIATSIDANGTRWAFQYNAGSASAFKWEFIGGPATAAQVVTAEGTAAAGPVDLATVGPSVTVARAGNYLLDAVAGATVTVNNVRPTVFYKVGAGAAAVLGECGNDTVGFPQSAFAVPSITAAAADVVKLQYGHSGGAGTSTFINRLLKLTPVRIS